MPARVYLAVDLGAESGRVMAGAFDGRKLRLDEVHRFANGPVTLGGSLRWDVLRLWSEVQNGLALAARRYGKALRSVGADTWGVDYVLLSGSGELLGLPYHYRDARTNDWVERACKKVSRARIFAQTGLQFMQINTLFQLLAAKEKTPELLEPAETLLFMPDFFHWALCGSRVAEFTIASTSQCLNPSTRDWAGWLLSALGLPRRIFPKLVTPGTKLGSLRSEIARRIGVSKLEVVAPPAHDTASAVAAVPTRHSGQANWAYLSSGTWSLLGVEVKKPSLTARTQELNFTNEGGLDGTCRLLKNIMGLWLVQECKRSFEARGKRFEYAELAKMASKAKPLRSLVDPDDARFLNPQDMPAAIQQFCRSTGQPAPRTEAELVRCAYESLALKYRQVIGWLEELTGQRIEAIHVVGGGSRNAILNQFAADACQRPVIAGPVEATAMGNILVQARADGQLSSLSEIRAVVRESHELTTYDPGPAARWDEAAGRFATLVSA